MKRCRLIILICALMLINVAQAVEVPGINRADVAVTNQSKATLQQALPKAFAQVLIKMSGNASVMTLPDVQNAAPNPSKLLQSYRYHWRTNDDGQKQLYVQITFDKKALYRILTQANQAIWKSDRPHILVWIKVESRQPFYILSSTMNNHLIMDLKNNAKRRGIPILLPTMDLQDQNYINNNSNQLFDQHKLQRIAHRYETAIVLAGHVSAGVGKNWNGQWLLIIKGEPFQWQNVGDSSNAIISTAVDKAVNLMANQMAVIDSKNLQGSVKLEIMNIRNLQDFVKLTHYLKNLAAVSSVSVSDMTNTSVLLNIITAGGQQQLLKALEGSHELTPISANLSIDDRTADLYYRWGKKSIPVTNAL